MSTSAVPADAGRRVALRDLTGQRGPVSPEAALAMLKQVLLALAAGHGRGLVHGSCGSGSVLVDAARQCKLTGAGVAPRPGAAASPEADLYAAAAMFFECLTGRPLPPSRDPQLAAAAASRVAPPLQALVAYGLATDPMLRPASARALAVELDEAARAGYGPYWEERGRSDLGSEAAAVMTAGGQPPVGARSGAPSRDGRGRGLLAAATVAAVALVAIGGTAAAVTLHGRHHQASLTGVQAAVVAPVFEAAANVTPPVAASACTAPSAFSYTGTVSATAAGTVRYQWVYSSGKPGPVQSVSFHAAGRVPVAGATVSRRTAGGGWGEIKLVSPVARTSDRASYKLLCGSGSADGVSATASVTPAARTASCDRTVPAFTATGSVKSAKAETVTYYWARSDGKDSAPATLTFTAAGTKPVQPLAVTPPAASGSGEAVLVVTSPVTTASPPATYTLTCQAPQAQPAGSPAAGAAGGQGSPTGPAGSASGAAGPSAGTGSPSDGPGTPAGQPTTPGGTGSSQPPAPTATQTSATSPAGGGPGALDDGVGSWRPERDGGQAQRPRSAGLGRAGRRSRLDLDRHRSSAGPERESGQQYGRHHRHADHGRHLDRHRDGARQRESAAGADAKLPVHDRPGGVDDRQPVFRRSRGRGTLLDADVAELRRPQRHLGVGRPSAGIVD